MSAIFEDNFNSYSDGNLDGQGSWAGDATFQVQGTTVYEGAKAVYSNGGTADVSVIKSGISRNDGSFVVYTQFAVTNKQNGLRVKEGTGKGDGYYTPGTGYISNIGESVTWLNPFSSGVWYKMLIEWRSSDHTMRGTVDNNTPTAWFSPAYGAWVSGLDTIEIRNYGSPGGYYVDYIYDPNPVSVSVKKPKFLTLLGVGN